MVATLFAEHTRHRVGQATTGNEISRDGRIAAVVAHNVKVVRPLVQGQSLTWADVAMDETTDAYKVRREMEQLFAPALQLARGA